MPLSPPATIGAQIASAVEALGITAGTPVTESQLEQVWTIVVQKIYADLQSNAEVSPGSFSNGGGPVGGVGGPIV